MDLSRRKTLAILGGGTIIAATAASVAYLTTREPTSALAPWDLAGDYDDPRVRHLSYAILAPNPHNRQPWLVDLDEPGRATLYVDTDRLLPHTDPFNRQITIGLGCFLGLLEMAAAQDGQGLVIDLFPQGEEASGLDGRPIATIEWQGEAAPDPLFAHVMARRSTKEPYDMSRPVDAAVLSRILEAAPGSAGTVAPIEIDAMRALTEEALVIEVETPRTYKESVDLFRIGKAEVNANPDGIDFSGAMFDTMGGLGLFTRETAMDTTSSAFQQGMAAVVENARTAMGYIWQTSATNTRRDQIEAGRGWLRINLACTAAGVATQPLSQALQEYPEMAALYDQLHMRLAPDGGTVQMLGRIGYTEPVPPSPRWPIDAVVVNA